MRGFGRTIALWGFIAVLQFLAGFDTGFVGWSMQLEMRTSLVIDAGFRRNHNSVTPRSF